MSETKDGDPPDPGGPPTHVNSVNNDDVEDPNLSLEGKGPSTSNDSKATTQNTPRNSMETLTDIDETGAAAPPKRTASRESQINENKQDQTPRHDDSISEGLDVQHRNGQYKQNLSKRDDNTSDEGMAYARNNQNKPNRRNNNRPSRQRKGFHQVLREKREKQKQNFEEVFGAKYYQKFFIIKTKSGKRVGEVDQRTATRQLTEHLRGEPANTTLLKDGSLLVEVADKDQSTRILNVQKFADEEISITPHDTLNQVKGTVRLTNEGRYNTEEIKEMLNEKNYNVTDVHQWKKRGRTGELLSINIYTITFGACQLPDTVKFGWERVIVKEFIPRPRRCFRCQRYGHNKNKCRRENDICVWCAQALTPRR